MCESEQPQTTIAVSATNTIDVMTRLPTLESVRRSADWESGGHPLSDTPPFAG
jgi:hypothetical protein